MNNKTEAKKNNSNSVLKFIIEITKPVRFLLVLFFLSIFVWAIDVSFRPYLIKTMINLAPNAIKTSNYSGIIYNATVYMIMTFFVMTLFGVGDFLWMKINSPLKRIIGIELMNKMMKHSHHFYQNYFAGSLGNKIKDAMNGIPDILELIFDKIAVRTLSIIIASFAVYTVNFKFLLTLLLWVAVFITGTLMMQKRVVHLSNISAESRSNTIGLIVDILSNIMSVRLFTGSKIENKNLSKSLDAYVNGDIKRDLFLIKVRLFQDGTFVLYQGISIFWLISELRIGKVTPGDFAFILTINSSVSYLLWSFSKEINKFSRTIGDVTQGLRLALSSIEIKDDPNATDLHVTNGKIEFDSVSFSYKELQENGKIMEPLFNGQKVVIEPNQKVGLVGYSGSGKSTFVNLILRLFDVTNGSILIDGQDISKVTQESLRKNIAVIPQDPSLFHRSIMENMSYGKDNATKEDIIESSKLARAHDFIEKIPFGYDALVGERGIKLSGGQRQRIAIARAFLKNSPILILDEATSQLDSVTEQDIQESLVQLMKGKTAIVIAHRLSTLLHMDRILVFYDGKIVEDGSHKQLLKNKGLYKRMWNTQTGGVLPEKDHVE